MSVSGWMVRGMECTWNVLKAVLVILAGSRSVWYGTKSVGLHVVIWFGSRRIIVSWMVLLLWSNVSKRSEVEK